MSETQRIVDAHLHWWDLEHNRYPWLTDSTDAGLTSASALAHTYLPEHYLADAEGYRIVGAVHVQANWDPADPAGETAWLQGLADAGSGNGMPQGIVAFADLSQPGVERLLETHARFANTRAIRHMLNFIAGRPELCWADQDYLNNAAWTGNFHLLARYGLGFDLMCFPGQMQPMARLAADNPEIAIYLEHAGMPYDHSPEGRAAWREGMRTLAAVPSVSCKISGLGTTMPDWTEAGIRPYVLDCIDIFGIDRCMFASNFPTDGQFSSMAAVWRAFFSIAAEFSAAERDKLFAGNAIRLYRLSL